MRDRRGPGGAARTKHGALTTAQQSFRCSPTAHGGRSSVDRAPKTFPGLPTGAGRGPDSRSNRCGHARHAGWFGIGPRFGYAWGSPRDVADRSALPPAPAQMVPLSKAGPAPLGPSGGGGALTTHDPLERCDVRGLVPRHDRLQLASLGRSPVGREVALQPQPVGPCGVPARDPRPELGDGGRAAHDEILGE